MNEIIKKNFEAYFEYTDFWSVFVGTRTPKKMMASEVGDDGWYSWKPIKGTLTKEDYEKVEQKFGVKFPESFIAWHSRYFFLNCSCQLFGLPKSSPTQPLEHLMDNLDYDLAKFLVGLKLYPFGDEGSDAGPLVFDGRYEVEGNEFPIRYFDHEYSEDIGGLSEIIFSSFLKLLECFTHYITELKTRKNYEIIPDFFQIDPTGAGKTGIDYWLDWVAMERENYEREEE